MKTILDSPEKTGIWPVSQVAKTLAFHARSESSILSQATTSGLNRPLSIKSY